MTDGMNVSFFMEIPSHYKEVKYILIKLITGTAPPAVSNYTYMLWLMMVGYYCDNGLWSLAVTSTSLAYICNFVWLSLFMTHVF